MRALAAIIKATGWRQPITVSTRSGLIVKGHGRLAAAKYGKFKEAPVDYPELCQRGGGTGRPHGRQPDRGACRNRQRKTGRGF
ncbi:MAG: hypothetical protein ACLTBV_30990 [Enterocloster bolteae]